jgi:hypothetical protein
MIRRFAAFTALLVAQCIAAATSSLPQARHSCLPGDGLGYICGPVASEDLVAVPGTPWLVASGLNIGTPAHLYLIDDRTRRARVLFPVGTPEMQLDPTLHSDCKAPPQLASLSVDGLGLRTTGNRQHLLYAANHGDRYAIEIFRLDARPTLPTLAWVGCVAMPIGTLPNAVVPLADGGLIISSFHDPRDKQAWQRMSRGENTGSVWEWHAGKGVHKIDIGPVSGANGLAISADERTLYVSAWSSSQLLVIDRLSLARRHLPLGFMPDNIKRNDDGTLLVAGQRGNILQIGNCGASCPQDWLIAQIDPAKASVTTLISRHGNELLNYACTALKLGQTVYITARGDQRIAFASLTSLPARELTDDR